MAGPLEWLKGWAVGARERALGEYVNTFAGDVARLFEQWQQEHPGEPFSTRVPERIGKRANILGSLLVGDELLASMLADRMRKMGYNTILVYGAYSPGRAWTGLDDDIGTYIDVNPEPVGPTGYRTVQPVDGGRIYWPPEATVGMDDNTIKLKGLRQ